MVASGRQTARPLGVSFFLVSLRSLIFVLLLKDFEGLGPKSVILSTFGKDFEGLGAVGFGSVLEGLGLKSLISLRFGKDFG